MPPRIQRITAVRLFFLPIQNRIPLKFGLETVTSVTCARVALRVVGDSGETAEGWGETPLSVQWVWPSILPYALRHDAMKSFCLELASAWLGFRASGHPLEIGYAFQEEVLPRITATFNHTSLQKLEAATTSMPATHPAPSGLALPWLAALVCSSPFDLALHDAYGKLTGCPTYDTYNADFLKTDLAYFLQPARDKTVSFADKYPNHFLLVDPPRQLPAWHLVGGLDLLESSELTGAEPKDGHPVVLTDWIKKDGLKCLKIKLRGNDASWDHQRLLHVGKIALETGAEHLSADFNCTVHEPLYVNDILDRLHADNRLIWDRLLYVEQPFPYDLEANRLDVHGVSARKPLFLDESAHDWRMVRLGRDLGWTGVALKTCKTQTGAILGACWAKAHGMSLMVQDLTNPMLAQIAHVLLAAHVGTIMGVETNSMQFYPDASIPEAKVHPGLYQRRNGMLNLGSIQGPGFGYRLDEIQRELPPAAIDLQ
jgi:L-alanine-DL-glutamate epimerase-like enolase superfamily enzyme